jgi:hypothetical protein
MAASTYGDLNRACAGGPCPQSRTGEISSGKMQQTVADIALAVGIAGAGACVPHILVSTQSRSSKPTTALAVLPGWVGWKGEW